MSIENKRIFPRANYPCSLTIWRQDSQEVIWANTSNISAGGLLVYLNQNLLSGTKVEINIEFSDRGGPLKCFGSVIRSQIFSQEKDKKFYTVALKFDVMPASEQARLKTIVDDLIILEEQNKKGL